MPMKGRSELSLGKKRKLFIYFLIGAVSQISWSQLVVTLDYYYYKYRGYYTPQILLITLVMGQLCYYFLFKCVEATQTALKKSSFLYSCSIMVLCQLTIISISVMNLEGRRKPLGFVLLIVVLFVLGICNENTYFVIKGKNRNDMVFIKYSQVYFVVFIALIRLTINLSYGNLDYSYIIFFSITVALFIVCCGILVAHFQKLVYGENAPKYLKKQEYQKIQRIKDRYRRQQQNKRQNQQSLLNEYSITQTFAVDRALDFGAAEQDAEPDLSYLKLIRVCVQYNRRFLLHYFITFLQFYIVFPSFFLLNQVKNDRDISIFICCSCVSEMCGHNLIRLKIMQNFYYFYAFNITQVFFTIYFIIDYILSRGQVEDLMHLENIFKLVNLCVFSMISGYNLQMAWRVMRVDFITIQQKYFFNTKQISAYSAILLGVTISFMLKLIFN